MSDLAIAALIMTLLIGLAIAAPLWGYDSRDGVESDQAARRVAWLDRARPVPSARPAPPAPAPTAIRRVRPTAAGVLRSLAYRLDADLAPDEHRNGTAARAC